MNLRRLKHMLVRLSVEEKILGIGALLVLLSAFMPWYSMSLTINEQSLNESGFSGDLGVIGFIIALFSIATLAFLMAEHLHVKLPNFGYKKNQIILFLTGESAFLVLLTIAIYTKRSLLYTNAGLRFGIYVALIGACMSAFASYAQIQRNQKKDIEAFFDHSEEEIAKTATIKDNVAVGDAHVRPDTEDIQHAVGTKHTLSNYELKKKTPEPVKSQDEQKSFFYDEPEPVDEVINESDAVESSDDAVEKIHESPQDKKEEQSIKETPAEEIHESQEEKMTEDTPPTEKIETVTDEIIESKEKAEAPDEEVAKPKEEEIDLKIDEKKSSNQSDYFMRDAGVQEKKSEIKVDIDSIKPVKKSAKDSEPVATDDTAKTTVDAVETRHGASKGDEKVEKKPNKKEAETPKMNFYDDL